MTEDRRYIKLLDEIERQGGEHLPGTCTPERIEYVGREVTIPANDKYPEIKTRYIAQKFIWSTGCHRERRVQIPDLALTDGPPDVAPPVTIACVVDDMVHLWPRFSKIEGDA